MITSNDTKGRWWSKMSTIIINEFLTIASSGSTLLVLVGGVFIYAVLYNLMYQPNLVHDAPIGIIDESNTSLTREYARMINSTSELRVANYYSDISQAHKAMDKNEIMGFVLLPSDFETRINEDINSVALLYANTDNFLYFDAMQKATSEVMMAINEQKRPEMITFIPEKDQEILVNMQPINVVGHAMYNPTMGYGTYLLPAVLIIILFQTMLMAIAMSIGGKIFDRSLGDFQQYGLGFNNISRVVLSNALVYCVLYAIFSIFMLGFIPDLFGLPHIGNGKNVLFMMTPFLLSTAFFAMTLTIFYTDKEEPLLIITFFSIGLIFLSGISYPLELMPWYWKGAHYIFPAAPAALAFVKLDCMGASLPDVRAEIITMWVQAIVYFFLACIVYRINIKKCNHLRFIEGKAKADMSLEDENKTLEVL